FFSSRGRHTRSYGDWSSDVCSSDLNERTPSIAAMFAQTLGQSEHGSNARGAFIRAARGFMVRETMNDMTPPARADQPLTFDPLRSEERRVGKERRRS